MTIRLGDLLVRNGALTPAQRDSVLDYQKLTGRPFGELAERLFGVGQRAVEDAWGTWTFVAAREISTPAFCTNGWMRLNPSAAPGR